MRGSCAYALNVCTDKKMESCHVCTNSKNIEDGGVTQRAKCLPGLVDGYLGE